MVEFSCIAAIGASGQIGEENGLPWPAGSIKGDMNYFKKITCSKVLYSKNGSVQDISDAPDFANAVIMGRKTWDSIPSRFKPLESRLNIIVTSSNAENYTRYTNLILIHILLLVRMLLWHPALRMLYLKLNHTFIKQMAKFL